MSALGSPSVTVLLLSGYVACLMGVAWYVDHLGRKSAARSSSWRTGNFVYHDGHDAWKCHEDEWLWPAAFDPEKRVIRYQGQHAICGRCPSKTTCSPTPGPREITRPIDPWPYSDAGTFHRGLSVVIAAVALMMTLGMFAAIADVADALVLGAALVLVLVAGFPLTRHLWNSPTNAPEHLPHEGGTDEARDPETPAAPTVEEVVDRYATRWGGASRSAGDERPDPSRPVDLPTPRLRRKEPKN